MRFLEIADLQSFDIYLIKMWLFLKALCVFVCLFVFLGSEAEPEPRCRESGLQWSSETEEEHRPVDETDITVSVLHAEPDKTEAWTLRKDEHEKEAQEVKKSEIAKVKDKEREKVCTEDVTENETELETEEECEKEQMVERDTEDSTALSEKERQNEELNEKDNCSASSISSASSTLEREEREEKLMCDNDAGKKKDTDNNKCICHV